MFIKSVRFLAPEDDAAGGGGGGAPDGSADFDLADLPEQYRERVERRIALERKSAADSAAASVRRGFAKKSVEPAGAAQPTPADPMAAIGMLVQLKVAEALGALGGTAAGTKLGPPVTGGGSPAPSNPVRTDTPIHKLSIPDREALRAELGPIEFTKRLHREMANVQITGVRR